MIAEVVAYGCFFLPEHLQVSGAGQTESPALSSLLIADAILV